MGKIRSKKWKGKRRPHPTGLPSVREAEQQQALEGPSQEEEEVAALPLLQKVRVVEMTSLVTDHQLKR